MSEGLNTKARLGMPRSRTEAQHWLNALNAHWAGVGLLALVNLYLLVMMVVLWQQAKSASPKALPAAIAGRNRRRALLGAVEALRQSAAPPPGPAVERLLRASDRCDPESFDAALEDWLRSPHPAWTGQRLLLVGSAPPDARWHDAVEQAGGRIVAERGDHSVGRLGEPIAVTDDPLRALGVHHHRLPYGPRSFVDRAPDVAALAARYRADGVILWMIEEDESMVWSVPDIASALEATGVPLLSLTRRRWVGGDDTADVIQSFVKTLRVGA